MKPLIDLTSTQMMGDGETVRLQPAHAVPITDRIKRMHEIDGWVKLLHRQLHTDVRMAFIEHPDKPYDQVLVFDYILALQNSVNKLILTMGLSRVIEPGLRVFHDKDGEASLDELENLLNKAPANPFSDES